MSDSPLNLNGQLGIFQILSPSLFCVTQSLHFQGPIKVSSLVWILPHLGQKQMLLTTRKQNVKLCQPPSDIFTVNPSS